MNSMRKYVKTELGNETSLTQWTSKKKDEGKKSVFKLTEEQGPQRQISRNKNIIISNKCKSSLISSLKMQTGWLIRLNRGKENPTDYCLQETHHTVKNS